MGLCRCHLTAMDRIHLCNGRQDLSGLVGRNRPCAFYAWKGRLLVDWTLLTAKLGTLFYRVFWDLLRSLNRALDAMEKNSIIGFLYFDLFPPVQLYRVPDRDLPIHVFGLWVLLLFLGNFDQTFSTQKRTVYRG